MPLSVENESLFIDLGDAHSAFAKELIDRDHKPRQDQAEKSFSRK